MAPRSRAASTCSSWCRTKFLTQNEIDAANQVHFDELNVQNQPRVTWPSNFIVARAYVDQLNRSGAVAPKQIATLNAAISKAAASPSNKKDAAELQTLGTGLEKDAAAKPPADAARMHALAAILTKSGAK